MAWRSATPRINKGRRAEGKRVRLKRAAWTGLSIPVAIPLKRKLHRSSRYPDLRICWIRASPRRLQAEIPERASTLIRFKRSPRGSAIVLTFKSFDKNSQSSYGKHHHSAPAMVCRNFLNIRTRDVGSPWTGHGNETGKWRADDSTLCLKMASIYFE